jgi:hypothetical protein
MGLGKGASDIEYAAAEKHASTIVSEESGAVPERSCYAGDTLYDKVQRFVGRYGVEQRGIERVPEELRSDKHTWKVGTMVGSQRLRSARQMLRVSSGSQSTWGCLPSRSGL